jgi:hypothetical protein
LSINNPQTPLPPLNPYPAMNSSPQTPVPVYLALNPSPLPAPAAPELSPTVSSVGDAVQQMPSMTSSQHTVPSEEVTEIRRKNFLQESNEKEVPLFWSVDPPEWSPLAEETPGDTSSSVPLTASEYLDQRPVVAQTAEPAPAPSQSDKSGKTFAALLQQMLPIVVVILLLLGLVGALLSSFLYK